MAHLSNIKTLDDKMLELMTVRHSADSGLRNPTLSELKEADKHVWEKMASMVSRFHYTWDDILFEFAEVRVDLSNRLGQRLKPPVGKGTGKGQGGSAAPAHRQHQHNRSRSRRATRRSRSGSRNRGRYNDRYQRDRSQGQRNNDRRQDGGERGRDRQRGGKDAGKGRGRLADQWPRTWASKVPDPFPAGEEKQLCMRYHLKGDCNFGAS